MPELGSSSSSPALDVELPRDRAAAAVARRQIRRAFGGVLGADRMADVHLAVSELVGNAVVHGSGPIRLKLELRGHRLRGEVIDAGDGFEHLVTLREPHHFTGRGLGIVEALADDWGVHRGSTHVWFILDVSEPVAEPGRAEPAAG